MGLERRSLKPGSEGGRPDSYARSPVPTLVDATRRRPETVLPPCYRPQNRLRTLSNRLSASRPRDFPPIHQIAIGMNPTGDERWMKAALTLAEEAFATDEAPIGAVLVRDDQILAS